MSESILEKKASVIAESLLQKGYINPLDRNYVRIEILEALKNGGTFQFLEDRQNQMIAVKTHITLPNGKVAMQG